VTSSSSRDPLNSSRIGFKGSEDLGGGMKLSFQLEGDLNPQDGSGDATGGGLTFDRVAFIDFNTGAGVSIQTGKFANSTKRIDSAAAAGTNLLDLGTFLFSTDTNSSVGLTTKVGSIDLWAHTSSDVSAPSTAPTANSGQGGLSEAGAGFGLTVGGIAVKVAQTQRGEGTESVGTISGNVGPAAVTALLAKSDTGAANGKTGNVQVGIVYPVAGLNLRASAGKYTSDTVTAEYKYMGVLVEKPLSKRTSIYVGYSDKDVNNGITGDVTATTAGITHSF
jgi:predicted porin